MNPILRMLIAVILAAALAASASIPSARADSAPPPPPEGANLFPDGEITEVRMESETVVMEMVDSTAHPDGIARVSAEFHMRNLGQQAEQMQVRFPLSGFMQGKTPQDLECFTVEGHTPIQDFKVWVDGKPVSTTTTDQMGYDFGGGGEKVKMPCWANFPVAFPVGQEVVLKVSYSISAYIPDPSAGSASFNYILRTGAGWKGTIGSARIIFRMPYDITPETYDPESIYPKDAAIEGREMTWTLEDFEPEGGPDVHIYVTRPFLWRQILKQTQAVSANAKDGEAWGMLGKALKQAIWERRGFRGGDVGKNMFRLSAEAYQQAVTLKPKDADWHAGYAELLCWDAEFPWLHDASDTRENLVGCMRELKASLDLNPRQAKANEILEQWSQWSEGMVGFKVVEMSGSKPVYFVLTATPPLPTPAATATILPTATPQLTVTAAPTATEMIAPTPTPVVIAQQSTETSEPAAVMTPAFAATATPIPQAPAAAPPPRLSVCGTALIPAAALVVFVGKRKKGRI